MLRWPGIALREISRRHAPSDGSVAGWALSPETPAALGSARITADASGCHGRAESPASEPVDPGDAGRWAYPVGAGADGSFCQRPNSFP